MGQVKKSTKPGADPFDKEGQWPSLLSNVQIDVQIYCRMAISTVRRQLRPS